MRILAAIDHPARTRRCTAAYEDVDRPVAGGETRLLNSTRRWPAAVELPQPAAAAGFPSLRLRGDDDGGTVIPPVSPRSAVGRSDA